jgi:hypothetical protein
MSTIQAYTTATRPTASASNIGLTIFNTTDKSINVSDGANWRGYQYDFSTERFFQQFTDSAASAYSLRKLDTSATAAVRVRRSSDNSEADIGFTANGDLDTSALTTHCGSGDGFVTKWYDQSGNSNDGLQTSTGSQPKIVSSGSVITQDGKPAIEFDGTDDFFSTTDYLGTPSEAHLFSVNKLTDTDNNFKPIFSKDLSTSDPIADFVFRYHNTSGIQMRIGNDGWGPTGVSGYSPYDAQNLITFEYNTSAGEIFVNGLSVASSNDPANTFTDSGADVLIGKHVHYSAYFEGTMQELIFYTSDQSSNRSSIETNINSYYSIF